MQNVAMTVEGEILVIKVDLGADAKPSASGKTMVIASTRGNAVVDDGKGNAVHVGLNVYRKR